MGTRADFYIGQGENAKWLGSIAWDGYPCGITPKIDEWPKGGSLFEATTEKEFKARLKVFFKDRRDVTLPDQGWPWPWKDSRTTDYSYAFIDGKVMGSCFGNPWFDPMKDEPDDIDENSKMVFPNMEAVQKTAFGDRSGIIVISR